MLSRLGTPILGETRRIVTLQVVATVGALIVNLLAVRALSASGFGKLALALQIAYLASVTLLMGLERAISIAMPRSDLGESLAVMRKLLRRPLELFAISTGGIGLVIAHNWSMELGFLVIASGIFILGNALHRAIQAAAISAGRLTSVVWLTAAIYAITSSAAVVLWAVEASRPWQWMILQAAPVFVASVIFIAWNADSNEIDVQGTPLKSNLRRIGYNLFAGSVLNLPTIRPDRLLLPLLSGFGDLGVYVIAASLGELVAWPFQAYANASLPEWRQQYQARPASGVPGSVMPALLGSLVFAAGYWVLGAISIVPLFGASYQPALKLLPYWAVVVVTYAISRVLLARVMAMGAARTASMVEAGGILVATIGCVLLIPRLHGIGASIAVVAGYGVAIGLSSTALYRAGRVHTNQVMGH